MKPAVLLLCGLLFWTPVLLACGTGNDFWTSHNVIREAGNSVWAYGQSWVEGPYYLYWIPYVTSQEYVAGSQVHGQTASAGYGGIATNSWHDSPSSLGVGLYEIYNLHEWYSDCYYYEQRNTYSSLLVERPTINGLNGVWWLGGLSDPNNGYYDAVYLWADPHGGPETPQWIVSSNPDKVSLSCSVCFGVNVQSREPSDGCVYDVAIKVNTGGLESTVSPMTVNRPWMLWSPQPPTHEAYFDGFRSFIWYQSIDMCLFPMTSVALNEQFGAWTDHYTSNTWAKPQAGGISGWGSGYTWADWIWYSCPACVPPTLAPQNPLSSVLIDSSPQSWRVASSQVGVGVLVQINTFQRFRDHGLHLW